MEEEKKDELSARSIGHSYGQAWSRKKLEMVKKFAMEINRKRTSEQRKKIEEMLERYRKLEGKDNEI